MISFHITAFFTATTLKRQLPLGEQVDFSVLKTLKSDKILIMNENYLLLYQDTILKLKNAQRPQIKLTPELLEELKLVWENALAPAIDKAHQNETIKKILCILDNSQNTTSDFNELFIRTLKEIKEHELIIYTLSASQKHVIADGLKNGK